MATPANADETTHDGKTIQSDVGKTVADSPLPEAQFTEQPPDATPPTAMPRSAVSDLVHDSHPGPPEPKSEHDPTPQEVKPFLNDAARLLNQYVLVVQLGAGGMGSVWKGWDTKLTRWVAIKFLSSPDETSVKRFQREAQTAGRLHHPNICGVHEVNEVNRLHFLVMDYIEGTSIDKAKMSLQEMLEAFAKVCRAVDYAHEQKIIHRDIKPANIMVSEKGEPIVTDFGLAKVLQTESSLSAAGAVLGTPAFMSPEQATGQLQAIDARSDIYSLGATLYQLATGRAPFQGDNLTQVLYKVSNEEPPAPRKANPNLPVAVEAIILKAMEKDKLRRYATAAEMAEDLQRYLKDQPIVASTHGKLARAFRKHPLPFAAAGLFGLLVLGGGAFGLIHGLRKKEQAPAPQEPRSAEPKPAKKENVTAPGSHPFTDGERKEEQPSPNVATTKTIPLSAKGAFYVNEGKKPVTEVKAGELDDLQFRAQIDGKEAGDYGGISFLATLSHFESDLFAKAWLDKEELLRKFPRSDDVALWVVRPGTKEGEFLFGNSEPLGVRHLYQRETAGTVTLTILVKSFKQTGKKWEEVQVSRTKKEGRWVPTWDEGTELCKANLTIHLSRTGVAADPKGIVEVPLMAPDRQTQEAFEKEPEAEEEPLYRGVSIRLPPCTITVFYFDEGELRRVGIGARSPYDALKADLAAWSDDPCRAKTKFYWWGDHAIGSVLEYAQVGDGQRKFTTWSKGRDDWEVASLSQETHESAPAFQLSVATCYRKPYVIYAVTCLHEDLLKQGQAKIKEYGDLYEKTLAGIKVAKP